MLDFINVRDCIVSRNHAVRYNKFLEISSHKKPAVVVVLESLVEASWVIKGLYYFTLRRE